MTLRQRQPRIEDPAWLELVRQMPCLVCAYPRSDPAHLRTAARQYGKRECGMQERPDDCWVLPLCRTDHRAQHDRGDELAWWASKGIIDPHAVAIALYATRPADLRPLPAPARPKKVRVRKPKSERRSIGKGPPLQSANRLPPKGSVKFQKRMSPAMTEIPTLAPCPFCGSDAKLLHGAPGCWFVQCQTCKASSDDSNAVERWNRRAAPDGEGAVATEPVAWMVKRATGDGTVWVYEFTRDRGAPLWSMLADEPDNCIPLFTHPAPIAAQPAEGMVDAIVNGSIDLLRRMG